MKLSYEDKLEIYQLRQAGFSWPYISRKYGVCLLYTSIDKVYNNECFFN